MNRHLYLFKSTVCLAFLGASFCGCESEKENAIDASLQIYGKTYDVQTGIIWQSNPYTSYERVPYIWEDVYEENGTQTTDKVEGFVSSTESKSSGNFMISLYQTGMNYNEQLKEVSGWGALVCFHLASKELERLVPGTYVVGEEQKPGTFKGYASSSFNVKVGGGIATVTEGKIQVDEVTGGYKVTFDCKTDFGGIVRGHFHSPMPVVRLPQVTALEHRDIVLEGLMKKHIKHLAEKKTPDVYTNPNWNLHKPGVDIFAKAFLTLSTGLLSDANGSKSTPDVALSHDEDNNALVFESPLHMRRFFGPSKQRAFYTFPCHTIYMKAPDTFTEADFEEVSETGLTAEVKEETVSIPLGDNFKPCYVFFRTGRGDKGVIRVRGFREGGKTYTPYAWSALHVITESRKAALTIDVKCPAVIYNPTIK